MIKSDIKKKKNQNYRIYHICKIIENTSDINAFISKKYYYKLLKKEIQNSYGYNSDYIKCVFLLFPLKEIIEYFKFSERQRPVSIRSNSLKREPIQLEKDLLNRGINTIFLKGTLRKIGMISNKIVGIGNCPEYLGGYYTFQGIASLFPIFSLFPRKNDRILDLAASPGGKTTHIAEVMENSGLIVANDKSLIRIKSLVSNIHRLGVKNSIVTNFDGSILPFIMKGFDKVLIDAPCSGSGISYNNLNFCSNKFKTSLNINSELQKRLLLAAIDSCDENSIKGGYIIYSTCSIFVEENENVIQYAVENRKVKIVSTELQYGMPGYKKYKQKKFNDNMVFCRRFFSHIHNSDGFFICKLKKFR